MVIVTVLCVSWAGDPSLTDTQLRIGTTVESSGIRQISQLIADDNYFRGSAVNPSWEWKMRDYGAPVNSLILNQNAVVLTLLQQRGQPLRAVWVDPA